MKIRFLILAILATFPMLQSASASLPACRCLPHVDACDEGDSTCWADCGCSNKRVCKGALFPFYRGKRQDPS